MAGQSSGVEITRSLGRNGRNERDTRGNNFRHHDVRCGKWSVIGDLQILDERIIDHDRIALVAQSYSQIGCDPDLSHEGICSTAVGRLQRIDGRQVLRRRLTGDDDVPFRRNREGVTNLCRSPSMLNTQTGAAA